MALFDRFRRRLAHRIAPQPDDTGSRRDFFRHAAGAGAAAVGAGLMLPDDAWAGVEERASRLGITPGTVVDANGRPVNGATPFDAPFIGAIVMFGGNFAPRGWAFCHGQLVPILANPVLFSILGTIYGGDGRTTFALPDLRGRVPIQQGNGPGLSDYRLGATGGQEQVTLTAAEVPPHTHDLSNQADLVPRTGFSQVGNDGPTYIVASHSSGNGAFTESTTSAGGGQSHENRPPFLAINFIIALQGIFPSRS
ncbi:MAG: tail fiber protein [Bacteroidota bacterium]